MSGFEKKALEFGVDVGTHQPAPGGDAADAGDRAVGDIAMPMDFQAGAGGQATVVRKTTKRSSTS
ncbi:MAG: hypothetical protein ACREQM_11930 [Candidatus Dormibacteraceae bacterium]